MRRRAAPDEFRSNVHRGGRTERARLSPELEALALKSAQILGLQVAGVDLIESDDGPLVLEVNSSPGLEGIENATGIDVAGTIVEHLEQQIAFPELDLRQRLGAAPTHVTAELVIGPNSPLEQRALGALDLQAREILVLTVTRGTRVIPTPGREFQLYRGDRLLCFGRAEALRSLMAEPPAGAARPSSESDVTGSLRAP
jgi:ribosomal protein S6--L-glutamate ligase